MADGRAGITASLVKRLIRDQFPRLSHLPLVPVPKDGWDNRTYRLGERLTVRLPTAAAYEPGITKENRWLPVLASQLPLPIPTVVGNGRPAPGHYPYTWSVREWITGETLEAAIGTCEGKADGEGGYDADAVAEALARFIRALQACDASDGPLAGAHCWFRGCPLRHYDEETRRALDEVEASTVLPRLDLDVALVREAWRAALETEWGAPPVWFHGDLAASNLLVRHGKLSAVLDFGTCGVGDPACDLVPAWTIFTGSSRRIFRQIVPLDADTWTRAKGWALWKGLITLVDRSKSTAQQQQALCIMRSVLDDS